MCGSDEGAWWCQPSQERPSKWTSPRSVFSYPGSRLDPQADLGQPDQFGQRGVLGECGEQYSLGSSAPVGHSASNPAVPLVVGDHGPSPQGGDLGFPVLVVGAPLVSTLGHEQRPIQRARSTCNRRSFRANDEKNLTDKRP